MSEQTQTLLDSAFGLLAEIVDGKHMADDDNPLRQLDMRLKAATTLLGKLNMLEQKAEAEDGIYLSKDNIEELRASMLRKLTKLAETTAEPPTDHQETSEKSES